MTVIVSREQWKARPAKRIFQIATPTRDLWLHHTAGSERGAAGMRQIQNFHMDTRGWSDIAYSFVIDPTDCTVYEGRGPGIAGGHTAGHNTTSHAICVMGDFTILQPTYDLLVTIADLIRHGRAQKWWGELTGGHRDASGASTACPGTQLENNLSKIRLLAAEPEGGLTVGQYEDLKKDIADARQAIELRIIALEKQVNGVHGKIVPTDTVRADIKTTRDIATKLGVTPTLPSAPPSP